MMPREGHEIATSLRSPQRRLDCGNPRCGFARIRCPDYGEEWMDYLEFIARVTSHIPDKGQVTVRYCGLYANAHRGKVKKASHEAFPLPPQAYICRGLASTTAHRLSRSPDGRRGRR
jgi:hypothetical protein